jgi:hypothetical protein
VIRYPFKAKVWRAEVAAAWHFVTLPQDTSKQIRAVAGGLMNAIGSLRVTAKIGKTAWKTSVFADTKAGAFVLPLKADVRRKEKLAAGDEVAVSVEIDL